MRKIQKEQADGFVKLLEEAHEEIIKSITSGEIEAAIDLLEQCHQGAIQLGTFIESTEGEGFVTVGILEEYCELLYNIHTEIVTGQDINISGVHKVLKKSYIRIQNSVNNDIKVRKEIVFLPYKAAMWDCLESVWKAADEDSECDVYVVPIPYYNKRQEETQADLVYEGNAFPSYVPITDYRKYDIEKRRPDVVYIHNPYDELNVVTNVHPDYYAFRLRELTNMLVYIPYFVAGQSVPNDLRVLPGTIYSHRVIVASESEKNDYIVGFEEWLKSENSGDYELYQPYWREKFLVLGSPKYDKVKNTETDINRLPPEWRDKIYKADGSRKKVIFYNTTIAALIKNDNMLAKIKRTIEIIKKEDEVVMWWRPHPLYESTIKSTCPHCLAEYKRIVDEYIASDVGIFDDTPDLNRAIAEADGYYGDGSSVVYLFQKANKPVMIQNTDI